MYYRFSEKNLKKDLKRLQSRPQDPLKKNEGLRQRINRSFRNIKSPNFL